MHRTCSTPKKKITRNVLGSERELRIERFMTAGFASRPLGEVGGVSRNRLLVDKMIVWRTILGLIMAGKWPEPECNLLAVFQRPTPRARDQHKQNPRCALLRPGPPGSHKLDDVDGRRPRFLRPICEGLLGDAVFIAATKERCGPVRLNYSLAAFLAVEILLLPSRGRS